MEPRIADALVAARGQLRDDAQQMDALMLPLLDEEALVHLGFEQVHAIGTELEQRRDRRHMIIGVLMDVSRSCARGSKQMGW
jgi:hypothetical protein